MCTTKWDRTAHITMLTEYFIILHNKIGKVICLSTEVVIGYK